MPRPAAQKIYAEIAGGGMSADAHHLTATHPEGLGAKLAMSNALEDAGMKPEDIDYINVHGTSTPVGDISEVKAIVELFGDQAHKLNISSTKSMTGHLLGATGALEAMFSVLAVKNDIVPRPSTTRKAITTRTSTTLSTSHSTRQKTAPCAQPSRTRSDSAATTRLSS